MIRPATILWAALAAIVGTGLFMLKYEVQAQEQRLAGLRKDIVETQVSIHVLKAEWSYLNDPSRLREQAERYLGFHSIRPEQIATIGSIPLAEPPAGEQAPVAAGQPAPQPAPTAATPLGPADEHAVAKPPAKRLPAHESPPVKPARHMTAARSPSAKPAVVASVKPRPTAMPSATALSRQASLLPAEPAPPAADVMVIKSPALVEPEMASTRARP
jgi:hypothetical protein